MLQEDEEDNVIEPELIVDNTISALPQFSKDFDIDAILSQVQSLENSSDAYADLSEFFNEIKNQSDNKELLQVIDKILSIIEFAKNLNITLEESVIEILSNGVKFCKAIVNGETPQDDGALLAQQLTVAKQLIEIANPQTKELATVNTDDNSPQNSNSFAKMKDFSHIFDTGEIKTLHVESSKLDAMVSQIGELIATKIKTTKQLSELNNLNDKLEDWQKDFSKLIRHLKSYDKRYSNTTFDRKTDFTKVAEAFGAKGGHASSKEELEKLTAEAFSCSGPFLIDCAVDSNELVLPMLPTDGSVDNIITEIK